MYVIAHINCALKVRDYAGWIDVDRTQGSTAQLMADAVEEAVLFQHRKDLVPVTVEEGTV